MLLSWLLALIAAFLGVDTSDTRANVTIPPACETFSTAPTPGDYSTDWYVWERCLLGDAYGEDPELTEAETRALVAEIWADYLPWMTQASKDSYPRWWQDGDGIHRVEIPVGRGWEPPVPRLRFGQDQVDECREGASGCHRGGSGATTGTYRGSFGIHYADGTSDTYLYYESTIAQEPGWIAVDDSPSLLTVLHEVAHAIDGVQWSTFGDREHATDPVGEREDERTAGHSLSFRCLSLDLLRRYYSDAVRDDAYETLNRLCVRYAPGYANYDNLTAGGYRLPDPAATQSGQRFSDVPLDHPDYAAIEWAATNGITAGYGDGTFRPDAALSYSHASVFLERYYGEVLGVDPSPDFTRSDMMRILYEIAGSPTVSPS